MKDNASNLRRQACGFLFTQPRSQREVHELLASWIHGVQEALLVIYDKGQLRSRSQGGPNRARGPMTKQDAYDFFFVSLTVAIVATQDAFEGLPTGSLPYNKLHDHIATLQRLLAESGRITFLRVRLNQRFHRHATRGIALAQRTVALLWPFPHHKARLT